jgi:hypothetical protein
MAHTTAETWYCLTRELIWQSVYTGPPLIDVRVSLSSRLCIDVRRAHERELPAEYPQGLTN